MRLFRNGAFLAAIAMSVILAMYFALVAQFAIGFLRADDLPARALGAALLVLPFIGVWYLAHEWRLGTTVQRMADQLEREGRLPLHDGERQPNGRLTEEAAEALFEITRRGTEANPEDWSAWFHVAFAYEANRDRSMARRTLRHAADLYRRDRRTARGR